MDLLASAQPQPTPVIYAMTLFKQALQSRLRTRTTIRKLLSPGFMAPRIHPLPLTSLQHRAARALP